MSRFSKLSHVLWHCQYHLIWVPKYRYRVLTGKVGYEIGKTLRVYAEPLGCESVELNVQADQVHLLIKVSSKIAISKLMGTLKGKTALQIFRLFSYLREKSFWGNHFWAKEYCVDTVGVDAEMTESLLRGLAFHALQGRNQNHVLRTWIFTFQWLPSLRCS